MKTFSTTHILQGAEKKNASKKLMQTPAATTIWSGLELPFRGYSSLAVFLSLCICYYFMYYTILRACWIHVFMRAMNNNNNNKHQQTRESESRKKQVDVAE